MSDESVASALRSDSRLVLVEAPAGCGKTYQAASYANEIANRVGQGRVLILTHTHAACDVFASRTVGSKGRIEIRTIDSMIGQICAAYHASLGLPSDTAAWARERPDGYAVLASKASTLLQRCPSIAGTIARRYPVIICDEHQDASEEQHSVIMSCHKAGAMIRFFGDPLQRIYGGKRAKAEAAKEQQRWLNLVREAECTEHLDHPHRWADGTVSLGDWILETRRKLCDGEQIRLAGKLRDGVHVFFAENRATVRGGYQYTTGERTPIDRIVNTKGSLLVLTRYNDSVDGLRSFFGRRLAIWEGHGRENLTDLVKELRSHSGDAPRIAEAVVSFLGLTTTGFSPSAFGNSLCQEVSDGCRSKRRGKPAVLQSLGRILLEQPNHKGVAKLLLRVNELRQTDAAFRCVKLDYPQEFWDAVRVGEHEDADEGLAEISRRRTYVPVKMPPKAISTIHKAKGLECDHVLILACDGKTFPDNPASRCLLYVALSRAKRSVSIVVSRNSPSPLLAFS